MKLLQHIAKRWHIYTFSLIVIAALAVRFINLNYNSAFNDEAIYVVLGKLGAFQGDWWTYNAQSWMAGQPFIYPTLSAMAYVTDGIVGSRALNVFFGVLEIEAIFIITYLLAKSKPQVERLTAALIAAATIGGSAVGLYVSRLATYDMLSFYLLFMGILFLLIAQLRNVNLGRWYFLAMVSILLSFFTKIVVAAYIPIIVIYSGYMARKLKGEQWHFWKVYFAGPLAICMLAFLYFNWVPLQNYIHSQAGRDDSSYSKILSIYWENSKFEWMLWAVASIGLFIKCQWKLWLSWTLLALVILSLHLFSRRWPTLDKHTFLSITFLFPLIGIGFSNLIFAFKLKVWRYGLASIAVTALLSFWISSYSLLPSYNNLWHNANPMLTYMHDHTNTGDKVLAEVGAAAILANYDHNFPANTVTFDYFEYKHETGQPAYLHAIKDGYFSTIELDGGDSTTGLQHSSMHNIVLKNISDNYRLDYKTNNFIVYERAF
jgi:hypothetical protein